MYTNYNINVLSNMNEFKVPAATIVGLVYSL